MSTSEISSELCPMEHCGEEQPEGLSSDIGGFLSGSCMETDEKSDPFNSENTLGFPEESSRFDSECILSSSLVEGVSMQQTTACDSSMSLFMTGDSFSSGNCSVLSGGSFLLYDMASSSEEKTTSSVMQLAPSNVVFLSETDLKGPEQKPDLPPAHHLSPQASHSQSHPVVIGNANAASFVKSVLKDATVLPTTSSSTHVTAKETVNIAPSFMLLNPTFLPPISVLQSVPGISTSPLFIQFPSSFGVTSVQDAQQLLSSVNSAQSQSNTPVTTSGAALTDVTCVSMDTSSADYASVMTSSDGLNPGIMSTPALSSESTHVHSSSTSSSTCHNAPFKETFSEKPASACDSNNSDAIASNSVDCKTNSCQSPAPQVGESQVPKASPHPVVISCMRPGDKGNKGMKQILEHFLQQNKVNTSLSAAAADSSHSLNTPLANTDTGDCGSASAPDSAVPKPQTVSVSGFDHGGNPSLFTVPSLGRKSSSVVFILRRTDSQAGKTSSGETRGSATEDKNMALPVPCSNTKDDEIDSLVTQTVSSTELTASTCASSESILSNVSLAVPCGSSEPGSSQQSAVITTKGDHSSDAQYEWVRIQVPSAPAEEGQTTAGDGSEDIQKLIPLTVNEKLSSNMCRPIIICIIQEDGLMKKVNINPVETNQEGEEEKGLGVKQEKMDTSSSSDSSEATTTTTLTDSPSPLCTPTEPVSSSPTPTQPSTPITHTPSHSSTDSSSPQTGSEGGSPPVMRDPSLKSSKDKQYKCDLCTAVFSRLGNYTRHRKIHTLNLKEDIHFKCPHCERPFLQRCDMNRHMAIHTNQFPFRCQTCGKGYIRKSDLVVHERFHSKNRAFKCETCGRAFYQSGDLSRHKRFVHMEQSQLSCGHCHRKYASEVTLIRHIKTAHNDILLQSAAQHTHQQ